MNSTPLNGPERMRARRIIGSIPGAAFEINVDVNSKDVDGLLRVMEAQNARIQALFDRNADLQKKGDQNAQDRAATRRYLGLDV